MEDGVSVIICCYNSAHRIEKTLEHLSNQQFSSPIHWEVIIVDNASNDNTTEVARQFWNLTDIPLLIVAENKKGLSNARKAGIRASSFNLISFIDDDNWVNSRWVEVAYNSMAGNNEVALLGGKGIAVFESEEPEWFNQFQRSFAVGPQAQEDGIMENPVSFLYGAGLIMRKHVWNKISENGFDFHLSGRTGKRIASGEDSEMCYAIKLAGYKLAYTSTLTFMHFMPAERLTIKYLKRLYRSFGRSSVIIDIYTNLLCDSKGIDKLKVQNYWIALVHSIYNILLISVNLVHGKFFKINVLGLKLDLLYSLENLNYKLRLFGNYGSYVRSIRNASWHGYRS